MAESWSLNGTFLESRNCESPCPCIMPSPPTEGECTALVGWRIDEGSMGNVDFGGLNVALAVHAPGHMAAARSPSPAIRWRWLPATRAGCRGPRICATTTTA